MHPPQRHFSPSATQIEGARRRKRLIWIKGRGLGAVASFRFRRDGHVRKNIVTHILIIVSWLGVANGAVISTQEFTSADRCDAARLALIEYAKARSADETLRPICLQK